MLQSISMLPDKLAFVDIETTGTSASRGRIIEIGIVRVEDDQVVATYNTLINPETHLPPEIEMLTGITAKDLEGQPLFRHVAKEILEMLADCVFVAHNVRFDYSFLKHEFIRENINFSSRHFCTVKLSRTLYPSHRHHNLDALIERFGFVCEKRHRAFDDAQILWRFYQESRKQFAADVFLSAVNQGLRRPTLPIHLKQDDLDNLPEQPGVYIFFGEELPDPTSIPASLPSTHIPLYIGKSINIRDRVLSHFSGDIHSPIEMRIAQQVKSIETLVTAGELGALFLELQLIKKMLPLYNRMLRIKRELVTLKKITDNNGYSRVSIETFKQIDVTQLSSFLGFFKSRKHAKDHLATLAKEHTLCEKLLDLEKTNTDCFAYRLGRCKGACIGSEKPLMYNFRFDNAFYKTKIKTWPFKGPILITEQNEMSGKTEKYVVDKWCYIGSIQSDIDGNQMKSEIQISNVETNSNAQNTEDQNVLNFDISASNLSYTYEFDLDMYKILLRYLSKPTIMKNIHEMNEDETNELFQQLHYL